MMKAYENGMKYGKGSGRGTRASHAVGNARAHEGFGLARRTKLRLVTRDRDMSSPARIGQAATTPPRRR